EWHSTQPPSRVKPYFQGLFRGTDLAVCVAACPVDVAHYREQILSGKVKLQFILNKPLNGLNDKQSG
ncbi:MAG: hypothetical protein ACRC2U_13245, partial [Aeromonas sp.]